MSSRRFTVENAIPLFFNWDTDADEEISETEDLSGTKDNVTDDPDCQFSYGEEDSEEESAIVSPSTENHEMQ